MQRWILLWVSVLASACHSEAPASVDAGCGDCQAPRICAAGTCQDPPTPDSGPPPTACQRLCRRMGTCAQWDVQFCTTQCDTGVSKVGTQAVDSCADCVEGQDCSQLTPPWSACASSCPIAVSALVPPGTTQDCDPTFQMGGQTHEVKCTFDGLAWRCDCLRAGVKVAAFDSADFCLASVSEQQASANVTCFLEPVQIAFAWTFAGETCGEASEVKKVVVSLKSSAGTFPHLPNDGFYPCVNGGQDGMKLTNFSPDTYAWELDAIDSAGSLLYSAAGSVDARLDATVTADLPAK